MKEFGRGPGKAGIRASIEKIVSTNTGKGSNQCEYRKIEESGEYREKVESVRVSKNYPDEYRKRVESV